MKRAGDWQALHFGCGVLGSHTMHDIQVNSERFFEPVHLLHGKTWEDEGRYRPRCVVSSMLTSLDRDSTQLNDQEAQQQLITLADVCLCRASLDSTNMVFPNPRRHFSRSFASLTHLLSTHSPTHPPARMTNNLCVATRSLPQLMQHRLLCQHRDIHRHSHEIFPPTSRRALPSYHPRQLE